MKLLKQEISLDWMILVPIHCITVMASSCYA
jgi:hypothetical protein